MSGGRNARQRRAACLTPASRDERAPQTTFGRRPLGTNSSTRFASCQTIAQPRRKQEPAAHRPALIRVVRSSDQFNHGDRCCSPRESRHRVLPLANLGSFRSWTGGPSLPVRGGSSRPDSRLRISASSSEPAGTTPRQRGWSWVHGEASADASPARRAAGRPCDSRARRPRLSPSFLARSGDVLDQRRALARAQGALSRAERRFPTWPNATMVGARGCRTASERRRQARRWRVQRLPRPRRLRVLMDERG
jgi:hypothetical protein